MRFQGLARHASDISHNWVGEVAFGRQPGKIRILWKMPENIGLPFTLYHTFSNMPLTEYWMALFKSEEILEVFNRVFSRATSQNKSRRSAIWSEITLKLSAFFDVFIFNYLSAYNTFCSLGLMYRTCNILLLEQLPTQYASGDNIQFSTMTAWRVFAKKRKKRKFSPVHGKCGKLKMGFADHHQYYSLLSSTNNTWMMFLSSFQHRIIQKVSEFRIKRRLIK